MGEGGQKVSFQMYLPKSEVELFAPPPKKFTSYGQIFKVGVT